MAGLNRVMLIGNLGKDPEIKYSQQGLAVVNFSIATSESWNDKTTGQKQEKTEWHRVCAFGKQAEILEKYLKKGSKVYIEGRLQTRSWEKDGQNQYTTEILISNFQFLDGKPQENQHHNKPQQNLHYQEPHPGDGRDQQQNQGQTGGQQPIPDGSDIPFGCI